MRPALRRPVPTHGLHRGVGPRDARHDGRTRSDTCRAPIARAPCKVRRCRGAPVAPRARVQDEHRTHARVVEPGVHAEQPGELGDDPGLLLQLTLRGLFGGLARLHEPGGQAPEPRARIEAATHQKHRTVTHQDDARGRHGIAVPDPTARRTGGTQHAVLVRHAHGGRAHGAEVRGEGHARSIAYASSRGRRAPHSRRVALALT